MDRLSTAARSRLMSHVRQKNTKPELIVRKLLHGVGYRFRLHPAQLPGRPDIVLPGRKAVVFVHGCFWHYHECHLSKVPSTRPEFWTAKLLANRERDRRKVIQLETGRWRVLTVWQCELGDLDSLLKRLVGFLGPSSQAKPEWIGRPAAQSAEEQRFRSFGRPI